MLEAEKRAYRYSGKWDDPKRPNKRKKCEASFTKIEWDLEDQIVSDSVAYWKKPSMMADMDEVKLHRWLPLPWAAKTTRKIPFGYEFDEKRAENLDLDPHSILFPIPEQLIALEKAKRMLKTYGLSSVTRWLVAETGREITISGLKNRVEQDKRHETRAVYARKAAVRLAKAIEAAQKIEETYTGATDLPLHNHFGDPIFQPGRLTERDWEKAVDIWAYVREVMEKRPSAATRAGNKRIRRPGRRGVSSAKSEGSGHEVGVQAERGTSDGLSSE